MKELCWHDGILGKVEFTPDEKGSSKVDISFSLYEDLDNSQPRINYTLQCRDISRFICTLDVKELNSNAWAGNISNGIINDGLLRLHVCGGLLEVKAGAMELQKC